MLVQSLWAGASRMPPPSDFDWTWAAAVGRSEPATEETGWHWWILQRNTYKTSSLPPFLFVRANSVLCQATERKMPSFGLFSRVSQMLASKVPLPGWRLSSSLSRLVDNEGTPAAPKDFKFSLIQTSYILGLLVRILSLTKGPDSIL